MSFVEMALSVSDTHTHPSAAVAIPWGHAREALITVPGIQWSLGRTQFQHWGIPTSETIRDTAVQRPLSQGTDQLGRGPRKLARNM